jgi:hypothetical protein
MAATRSRASFREIFMGCVTSFGLLRPIGPGLSELQSCFQLLPACLLPRRSEGSNPAPRLTTELSHPEQFLDLRLYHQGLARMREEKVIDGTTEPIYFPVHPIDHLLLGEGYETYGLDYSGKTLLNQSINISICSYCQELY